MEITYHGGNCLRIIAKKSTLVVDDNLAELGLKTITKPDDITLITSDHLKATKNGRLVVAQPGEYEVSDISVQGVAARGSMDDPGTNQATMYKITADDITVLVLGHVFAEITDEELEELGHIDVLFVPVGGTGYTLDGVDALKLVKKIEPKVVVPTHYSDKALKYEVAQESLEDGIKGLAMEPSQTLPKLKLKPADIPENVQLWVLERQ